MRVAIVGAGASGLTAAKALLEVGLTPVIYEASALSGGLWVYREGGTASGPAYRSLRTNTSKQITAFSDVPFADTLPNFPARADVEAYLARYASMWELRPLIRFGCRVLAVAPLDREGWHMRIECDGYAVEELFDAVLICTGIFRKPIFPDVRGLDQFRGHAIHSNAYRVPERFAGQDVLVVGLGSSAADVAVDLCDSADRVTLCTRRGAWIVPREVGGRPLDHRGNRLSLFMPEQARIRRRQRLLIDEYARRGMSMPATVWKKAGIPFSPNTAPSVGSDDLLPKLLSGEIGVRPAIMRVDGRRIIFADGTSHQPDAIVYCTGYDLDFPFLPASLAPWTSEGTGLYRLVFPPGHSTLGFIGVCRAHGPIFPIVEMQARWAARVLAGERLLPERSMMAREILHRLRIQRARRDSTIRVNLIPYLDEVGSSIGVRPQFWRHAGLLCPLLTGPPVAAQYRLDGPDRWDGAPTVIRRSARQKGSRAV